MNTTNTKNRGNTLPEPSPLARICIASCRKLVRGINKVKATILSDFREALGAQGQLLRLALNEAEALAWQTEYPHLVFPMLAVEKAQAVATWQQRQRALTSARTTAQIPVG